MCLAELLAVVIVVSVYFSLESLRFYSSKDLVRWRNSKLSVASCQLRVANCQLISVSCQLVSVSCYFGSDKYFVYCWPNSHVLRH